MGPSCAKWTLNVSYISETYTVAVHQWTQSSGFHSAGVSGLLFGSAARCSPSRRVGQRQQAGYNFCTSCWSKINYLNSFFPVVSILITSFWRHSDGFTFFFPSYRHQFNFILTLRSPITILLSTDSLHRQPLSAGLVAAFVCLDSRSGGGGHAVCRCSTPSFHALNKAHGTSAQPF